jgi:hypothetical protein
MQPLQDPKKSEGGSGSKANVEDEDCPPSNYAMNRKRGCNF